MPENFHIDMPEAVRNIIHTIEEHGFKAYAVGGCIRDSILGRNPDDWDITTSAVPSQIKTFFKRTVDTGIAHGTVTIMIDTKLQPTELMANTRMAGIRSL